MRTLIAWACIALFSGIANAQPVKVTNAAELNKANESARPGDTIILQNGQWNNVSIRLNCSGTSDKPILFKAETAGKVMLSGVSELKLGGSYLIVDGLWFTGGYSPSRAVIDFRINKDQLANYCRVTNCVIDDFNKPKRMQDDDWVAFSGKYNRLDHCSFLNKKNMGALLAVLLDDDRSRENFHSIDHNYFGIRPALASNGGEIIRIGLSQHCQFNSNTLVTGNYFEYCDGEAEVISVKSCGNTISDNVFKESQGSVVLRHGNYNTVKNNIFLGNGKEASGGVRIVNRGQWVINNFFYRCRGESFRAPVSIMNGIPNSPAHRYVQVTESVVMNNTFVDCTPLSLCEGSDKERTLPPENLLFAKNIFYNRHDSLLYKAWDDISGIRFAENEVQFPGKQPLPAGFNRTSFIIHKMLPTSRRAASNLAIDSLMRIGKERLPQLLPLHGYKGKDIEQTERQIRKASGAAWYQPVYSNHTPATIGCNNAASIYQALEKQAAPLIIRLTGRSYLFDRPMPITTTVEFIASPENKMEWQTDKQLPALFALKAKGSLRIKNLRIAGAELTAHTFIDTDTSGSPDHYSLHMSDVTLSNFDRCKNLLNARTSTLADSIIVQHCHFDRINNGFSLAAEKTDKGYYNAGTIRFTDNQFTNGAGILLDLYRGGSDESTLGPQLIFSNNRLTSYSTANDSALLQMTGVQKSVVTGNHFSHCNAGKRLIVYKDVVRAIHYLSQNNVTGCGTIEKNQFVTGE